MAALGITCVAGSQYRHSVDGNDKSALNLVSTPLRIQNALMQSVCILNKMGCDDICYEYTLAHVLGRTTQGEYSRLLTLIHFFSKSDNVVLSKVCLAATETPWLFFNPNSVYPLKLPAVGGLFVYHVLKVSCCYSCFVVTCFN